MTGDAVPAYGARRLEAAAALAVDAAERSGAPTMLVFRDVAALVEPGEAVDVALARYDAAVASIVERETDHPLLSDAAPRRGDVVETLADDHFLRIPAGSPGIVVATTDAEDGRAERIAVRFGARSADYEAADFPSLRHLRAPRR